MEQKFHEQFYKIEHDVSMIDLFRLHQIEGELIAKFYIQIQKINNRCHLDIPECDFVKIAQSYLNYKLNKKFEGMEFTDLSELVSCATKYEKILKEEIQRKNSSRRFYYKDANIEIHMVGTND